MADENEKPLSLSEYMERINEIDASHTERSWTRDVPWLLFVVFLALGVGIGSFEIASAIMGDALALALGGLMFAAVILVVDKRA